MSIATGSLIWVNYSNDSGRWLGLVVDQKAGEEWAKRDPCVEYSLDKKNQPLLVRVLGLKLTEGIATGKSAFPEREPRQIETVRWAFVETIPNPPLVVAGPDADSIIGYLKQRLEGQFYRSPDLGRMSFLNDLELLVEYLGDNMRETDEMSLDERKFFVMLAEVLPR